MLYDVFSSSVHGLASKDYTAEQIQAWAPAQPDHVAWTLRILKLQPHVVEIDGKAIAYGDVQPDGYIDHFFVCASHARKGIGTRLMQHLHAIAAERGTDVLSADVSRTAQPFFARLGFSIVEHRFPVVRGVVVPNAHMHRRHGP